MNDKHTKSMKKGFVIALILLFVLLTAFSLTSFSAFAENRLRIDIVVDGVEYSERVSVSEKVIIETGGSFYDFALEKLLSGCSPQNILDYFSLGLGKGVFSFLAKNEKMPINATMDIDKAKRKFLYTAGKSGLAYDKKQVCLAYALALDGKKAELNIRKVMPEITLDDLKNKTRLMASFSTDLTGSSNERKHNIKLSAEKINGVRLAKGERFSFNSVVGERTEERGFRKAKVILDGEYVYGYGGGVCQTATTLYNAVLLSGLKVVRVARHSYPAKYVGYSRDAMVSSASDFVFENDGESDIYIFATCVSDKVTFSIYGEKRGEYRLVSKKIGRVNFFAVDEKGNKIEPDQNYRLLSKGIEGIKSELYLLDSLGNKKRIRQDEYKSKNAVYRLGEQKE